MTKVKMASKTAGLRRSTKSNNTNTPTIKGTKGKIQKNRPNIKGEKTNAKENDYISKYLDIQSKTRLCFVKIKRIRILNSSSNTNSVNKISIAATLQAQCVEDSVDNNNHKSQSQKEGAMELEASLKNRGPRSRQKTNACNDDYSSPVDKSEIFDLSLEKTPRTVFHDAVKDRSDNQMAPLKRSNNLELSVHDISRRRCEVKIKRVTAIGRNPNKYACSVEKNVATTSPTFTRKCKVKLRKYPIVQKSIPTEELYAIAELEDEMLLLSRSQIVNPALDQEKREAFRKLALPKTKSPIQATTTNNKKNGTPDNIDEISKNTQQTAAPKQVGGPGTADSAMKRIQFVPQQNSTMHFEHFQSSTAIEFNKSVTNNNNMLETEAAKQTHIEDNQPSTPISKSIEHLTNISSTNNKKHKFFHRHENQSLPENQRLRKAVSVTNKNGISKKPRLLTKRSSQAKRENVYDFLSQSQSQTSDSDANGGNAKCVDPMADIIKKLIDQGKVAVAVNQKGKGRPKLKRNKTGRKINKATKQTAAKKCGKIKSKPNRVVNKEVNNVLLEEKIADDQQEDDDDHFDHFMDDGIGYNMNNPLAPSVEPVKKGLQHHVTDQEGTFSKLAKSVLISQAGRSDPSRVKAQRLLAMAKKLISTPINNKPPSLRTSLDADFSPILMPNKRPPTRPSPWRVDEDAHLPRMFNFSRSSGNLPSFSSDVIPPTPRKEKPKNNTMQVLNEMQIAAERHQQPQSSPLPQIESVAAIPSPSGTPLTENQNLSVPSSFSSNDSNAENNPPPTTAPDKATDYNANIFDLKQLPNPRRALTYRSPLKAINILEVVHLPPIQNLKSLTSKDKTQMEMFGFEDIAEHDTFKTPLKPSNRKKSKKNSPQKDLFGFEEFLSQNDTSSQESIIAESIEEPNNSIHDKLHSLRKLRPDSSELQPNLHQTKKVPNLFNDAAYATKQQKSIKEMLCSTMVEPRPSTSKKALEELHMRNLREKRRFDLTENGNISALFKDPEPETTFNEEDPHRTYVRPYKRKRRLRENKLVYVFNSDVSGDEHDSSTEKKKRAAHHQSHETDTSSEQPHKKKRQHKEKPEMKNFVEEFKEMCKEVESYELIVEKSA